MAMTSEQYHVIKDTLQYWVDNYGIPKVRGAEDGLNAIDGGFMRMGPYELLRMCDCLLNTVGGFTQDKEHDAYRAKWFKDCGQMWQEACERERIC